MRIRSVRVQNYRIHRDLSVAFDSHRTLIGGPNECGKSTLAEAMHRGFFMKAKGDSLLHRALLSTTSHGSPQIDMEFDLQGQTYRIRKTFGKGGSTILERGDREPLRGDEAEEALAQLLKSGTHLSKSALENHWGHLWVWQGTGAADPSPQTAPVARDILQRLQSEGAGAVLMSSLDQKVADGIRKFLGSAVGTRGSYLAGSPAAMAQAAMHAAQTRHAEAMDRVQTLEQSIDEFHRATGELARLAKSLGELEKDEAAYHVRADRVAKLSPQLKISEGECEHIRQRLEALKKADADIRLAEKRIQSAEASLRPQSLEIEQLGLDLAHQENALRTHDTESQRLAHQNLQLRTRFELVRAHERRMAASEQREALERALSKINALRIEKERIVHELLRLPNVTEETLHQITRQSAALDKIRASLDALGVRFEWVSGSQAVTVGALPLEPGKPVTVLEAVEIAVNPDSRIRVCPGNGLGITDLRRDESEASSLLEQTLRAHTVQTLEEARTAFQHRQLLETQRGNLEAELRGLNPEQVRKASETAERELQEAKAIIERLSRESAELPVPTDLLEARELAREISDAIRNLEVEAARVRSLWEQAEQARNRIQKTLQIRRETARRDEDSITSLRSTLALQQEQSGDADQRGRGIIELDQSLSLAEASRGALTRELSGLEPAQLEAEFQRLQRWRAKNHAATLDWNGRKAGAEALLSLDGSRDPRAELAVAEAERRSAEETLARHVKRIEAFQLLSGLFDESQQVLNEKFTRPLKDKIDGYLRHMFGSSAGSSIDFSDQGLSEILLHRGEAGHSTFRFDALSSGTREQTAAAVRLAVAEVLAADYGGSIPVILDDAFTNSDPERVRSVIRMLDYAAERGLQVILLSCTPEDYSGLGAETVFIDKPSLPHGPALKLESEINEPFEEEDFPTPAGEDVELMERFKSALKELGASSGNTSLRLTLQWDSETYARIRGLLLEAGKLRAGRGRGGSVSLVQED
jgi:DNA repair exonuclease SbcCD ATPase subunit